MLYNGEELKKLSREDEIIPIQRYFHKIHKGETSKLAPHECEYLASTLRSTFSDQEATKRVYDPEDLYFLSEAVFKRLILLYLDNLDFLKPVFNGLKNLSDEEIFLDKATFCRLLNKWEARLNSKQTDRLTHEVRLEYLRKLNILKEQRACGLYGRFLFERKSFVHVLRLISSAIVLKTFRIPFVFSKTAPR